MDRHRPRQCKRIAITGELLPHYRQDVFVALDQDARVSITFFAGPHISNQSIPSMDQSRLARVKAVRNRYWKGLLWQSGLLVGLLRGRFDSVVLPGDIHHLTSWVCAVACRLTGTRVLFWTIGWHRPDKRTWHRLLRVAFYRLAHELLLYGDVGYSIGVASGYPSNRMTVIRNSTSTGTTASRSDTAKRLHLSQPIAPGTGVVTAILRLTAEKCLNEVIEAASVLSKSGKTVAVVLVGEGPEQEALEKLASIARVQLVLLGAIYDEQTLSQVYSISDATVVPGPAGLTVLQSLRHGVPVITHDNDFEQRPESEAIRNGVTGSRFIQHDIDSLAASILFWTTRTQEQRELTRKTCIETIANDWSAQAHCERIIQQLIRQ